MHWSFSDKYLFKNTNAFETGLGDHHLLIYSMLKTSLQKNELKQLIKWGCSNGLTHPDPSKIIVNEYKNHPSIEKIKSKYITVKSFLSNQLFPRMSFDVIFTLVDTKSSGGEIPLSISKENKILSQDS